MWVRCWIGIILCWIVGGAWMESQASSPEALPKVHYILESNSFLHAFPPDQSFIITGEIDYHVRKIQTRLVALGDASSCSDNLWDLQDPTALAQEWEGQARRFYLQIPSLRSSSYCVQFRLYRMPLTGESSVPLEEKRLPPLFMKTSHQAHYLTLDLGGVLSSEFSEILPYVGVNLYLSPILRLI